MIDLATRLKAAEHLIMVLSEKESRELVKQCFREKIDTAVQEQNYEVACAIRNLRVVLTSDDPEEFKRMDILA